VSAHGSNGAGAGIAAGRAGRDGDRPVVAVYRSVLMNYNEVYLRTEAEALRRYRPVYVGSHRPPGGVELPADRTITLRERYRAIDRRLDPLVVRIGWRLEHAGPLAPIGRHLRGGNVVGRFSEYAFHVHGVAPALLREVRALRPAIMHAYTGVSGAHALPLARRLGVPLVVSFGGTDATATDEAVRRGALHGEMLARRRDEMKRELALIVTVSEFLRGRLVERGWPAEKIEVVHRGIDTGAFTPEGAPPLADRAPVVFYAGRLIEVKGTAYLLRAMRAVQARVPDAELVIAGSGALRKPLEEEARALGVRARFLGSISADEVRAWHRRAAVYCMPSVTASTGQREGLSNALLESMSAGLPVVASRSGGIPEAVGDAGFLVEERDVEALARHIGDLLTDASLRERHGRLSRDRVLRRFDLRAQAARLELLYDRVRAERARAGAGSR